MSHYLKLRVTDEQRANLEKLYEYLANVPEEEFDMSDFAVDPDASGDDDAAISVSEVLKSTKPLCGAVCCMVGNGPLAGVKPVADDVFWHHYADRAFGANYLRLLGTNNQHPTAAWDWLFHWEWSRIDNTPEGGRKRLRLALDKGIPNNYYEQLKGTTRYRFAA